ncbi:hypothetical protein KFZ70_08795 [Tamlana fucoidanivorans]|uniref:Uncharacterized protein n=1 Tax=Allotamlana fucoidanivorans TaxID=2583814 RepID=A0A5C4SPK2_9FLAO|nr:hypothetical protein [Tamlana fucoidanivorans]TNJ46141.1 hypothetical protein FGF67_03885 [Tamlana fucoidanivorans]
MIARWCISIFVLVLTLFGVVSQQQTPAPNQEIVLEFAHVELSSEEALKTIGEVKEQLQEVGVTNVQIKPLDDGKLKISYFSESDVTSVKRAFAKNPYLAVETDASTPKKSSEIPSHDESLQYHFDIYEIEPGDYSGWDFNGSVVLQLDNKSDRFLDPSLKLNTSGLVHNHLSKQVKVSYRVQQTIAIALDTPLHSIPEVRAGPNS